MEGAEGGRGVGEAVGQEVWGVRGSRGPALTWLRSCPPVSPQKTATAVAHCKRGNGLIKVNGRPLEMIEPRTLQYKVLGLRTGVGSEWRTLGQRCWNKRVPAVR